MSKEVGSGHVSIFPVMPGFRSKVAKESGAAGVEGARTFSTGFKGAGARIGSLLGRDMKSSFSSAANGIAADQLKSLNRDVASAASALSKSRLAQQDEAGRVRVAETRLQETIAKYGETSSQAVAAEERLAAARRRHEASVAAVAAASDRMRNAQTALTSANALAAASATGGRRGLVSLAAGFRDGFRDANAARSAFTGVAGSLGGLTRGMLDVTGVSKLARLGAAQVSTAFTSMATMVGGGLAKGWASTKSWLGGVGGTVRGAFGPALQYAASAGTLLASPFMKLGSKVSTWLSPVTTQVRGMFAKIGASAGSGLSGSLLSGLGTVGSAIGRGLSSVVSAAADIGARAGAALGRGLQSTATGAVGAVAAGVAVAVGKGFSRLAAIDTAQAKLRGLGNDASTVTSIMGDALASVKGTSFGLGEAATVAASAVAAGIKPGEALQGHLKRIANNASAAGMSMQDMGSIFNRAATQANGVQNDVISQLADKGIPIYQALADQMGVTAGEVFKMASDGKVDFETFSRAAEAAAGTVSQEIGKTVPGAAKNLMAAMGRIGANALGPLYAKIGPLIQAATSALGPIEDKAKTVGAVLGKVLGPPLDFITNLLNRVGDGSLAASSGFGTVMSVLGPLGGAFAALGAGGLAGVLAKLGPLGAMLPGLGGLLGALGSPLGIAAAAFAGFALSGGDAASLVDGITGIIGNVVSALPPLVASVVAAVPSIVSGITSQIPLLLGAATAIVGALVQGLGFAIPVLASGAVNLVTGLVTAIVAQLPFMVQAAMSLVGALVQGLVAVVPMLVDAAVTLVTGLVDLLIANLPTIIQGAIQLVTALIIGIVQALPLLVTAALKLVTGLLTAIVAALPVIIQGGVQLLMALISGIIQALPMILEAALQLVTGLLLAIVQNLPMIIDAGIQLLISLLQGLIGALPMLIEAAINLVVQLVAGLLQALPQLIEAGIQLVISLITGLVQAIPQIIEMLPQIVKAIWDGFANVDWGSLGMQIINGLIDGLKSMTGPIGDAMGGVVDFISGFFPHSPAKRGPLSGAGWTKLRQSGASMFDQFNAGAQDQAPAFGDNLAQMAADASSRAQAALGTVSANIDARASAQAGTGGSGAGGSGTSVQQTNHFDKTDPKEAVELANQQLNALLRKGS